MTDGEDHATTHARAAALETELAKTRADAAHEQAEAARALAAAREEVARLEAEALHYRRQPRPVPGLWVDRAALRRATVPIIVLVIAIAATVVTFVLAARNR